MERAFNDFIEQVSGGVFLPDVFLQRLKVYIRLLEYVKGDTWLVKGASSQEVLFVRSGSAMSYRLSEGREWITNLWKENEMIIEGSSLLPRPNPNDRIVFLEDSTVLAIDVEKASALQREFPTITLLFNRILVRSLKRLEDQYILMQFSSPKMRLQQTQKKYTRAFNLLLSDQKASYLGISRPTLYRLLN